MLRLIIIAGIILFMVGIYAELALASWSSIALIAGTILTYAAVILWLLSAENRKQLKQRVPVLSSTSIGDVTVTEPSRSEVRAARRSAAPYASVMSFCFFMALVHIMTFYIHKSPLYQTATQSLSTNEAVMNQVGEVKGYSYAAVGILHDDQRSNFYFGIRGTTGTYWVEAVFNVVNGVQTLERITPVTSGDVLFGK